MNRWNLIHKLEIERCQEGYFSPANFLVGGHLKRFGFENRGAPWEYLGGLTHVNQVLDGLFGLI